MKIKIGILLILALVPGCKKEKVYDENAYIEAVVAGDIETMQLCLDRGINIGDSIIYAAEYNSDSLNYLLGRGADPNYTYTLKSLFKDNDSLIGLKYSFPLASTWDEPESAKKLIAYGANVNAIVEPNANLLMYYIQLVYARPDRKNEALASVRILLENGADMYFRGENGLTPLLLALNYNELRDVVDLLFEFGIEPSAELVRIDFNYDPLGFREWDEDYGKVWQSEFLLLAGGGYDDLLMPYIEKGAVSPDHADPDGWDIYCYAAESGNPYLMMKLLPYLKDPNGKRYDNGYYSGMTLLFIASMNGNKETAKVLLENGIDIDTKATAPDGHLYYAFSSSIKKGDIVSVAVDFREGKRYPEYRILPEAPAASNPAGE
ncbi:MAG: ankyrin repeat domain-containing protein [Spirochaetaceae bacterium]|jgi:ankyrin repeat protein|nr:ankyrin repeat domain-containing protein [Spirochaetaceae bacterium]